MAFSSSRFLPCCQGSKRHDEGGTRSLAANTLRSRCAKIVSLRRACRIRKSTFSSSALSTSPSARPDQLRSDQGAGDNTVLDIAKIESDQFSLAIGEHAIAASESLAAPWALRVNAHVASHRREIRPLVRPSVR
jgi:hypothetical protein